LCKFHEALISTLSGSERNGSEKIACGVNTPSRVHRIKVKTINYVVPSRISSYTEFSVSGWNTSVRENYDLAHEAFLLKVDVGKLIELASILFEQMKKTRAFFNFALRYCKIMKADACDESLLFNDYHKFWENVYKILRTVHIAGDFGCRNIADAVIGLAYMA
jgi:hypothetical protein